MQDTLQCVTTVTATVYRTTVGIQPAAYPSTEMTA